MGYETKLFICEPSLWDAGRRKARYASIIASIDLCKAGDPTENGLEKQTKPLFYIYGDDGNRRIMRDLYGECLSVGTRDSVLEALRKKSQGDDYRRYAVAIAMLRSLTKKHFPDVIVLGYGPPPPSLEATRQHCLRRLADWAHRARLAEEN